MSARTLREEVIDSLSNGSTDELANLLLLEYDELIGRFAVGDHRPTELSGARFAEAAFRICQMRCGLAVTPIGTPLTRSDGLCRDLEQVAASRANDSFRIHIPRVLRTVYDFRSKRDVAHLGNEVSPNFADSSLVTAAVSWVLAEFVRLFHQCDAKTAQAIVDALVDRKIPLVWQKGNIIRVLDPKLSFRDKTLVVLYHLEPHWPSDKRLYDAVEYSNSRDYCRKVLEPLHKEAMIDYRNGVVRLLPPGKRIVEIEILQSFAGKSESSAA